MATTLVDMAKKMASNGEQKRQTLQVPAPWYSVINRICAQEKQPQQLWVVLDLVAKRADELEIERPKLPWEELAEG